MIMKERFEQFIVQSKKLLLGSEYHDKADKISFVCQIVPFDEPKDDNIFAMLMSSGIMTKPEGNNQAIIIPLIQDMVVDISIEDYKKFMVNYSHENNPDLHTELIVPNAYYDFLFNTNENVKTLEDAFELLDISEKEFDWFWALSGGVGFRLIQDIVD